MCSGTDSHSVPDAGRAARGDDSKRSSRAASRPAAAKAADRAAGADASAIARLEELAGSAGVVAVGETGLDYYRDRSPREAQKALFTAHVAVALRRDLPVIVHCREAYEDCLPILARYAGQGSIDDAANFRCVGP